jgi:hypothetical protein
MQRESGSPSSSEKVNMFDDIGISGPSQSAVQKVSDTPQGSEERSKKGAKISKQFQTLADIESGRSEYDKIQPWI